jgi:hypothetical protein
VYERKGFDSVGMYKWEQEMMDKHARIMETNGTYELSPMKAAGSQTRFTNLRKMKLPRKVNEISP